LRPGPGAAAPSSTRPAEPVTGVADLAAFDFDGTITDGGSVFDFLSAVAGRRTVVSATAALAPHLAHAALAGGQVADRNKERLFVRVLAGIDLKRAEDVAETFARDHLDRHVRADVRRRLDWHLGRGDQVIVVSASPELYVGTAGELLGVDGVVATGLAVDADGRLTGRYRGANCRGEEKLRRLRAWIDAAGAAPDKLWAYGNSRGDLRMLRAADVGVNVGRLGSLGRLRDFPGLDQTRPDG
jgi:phosphatidylglycerophosphatase C